MLNNSFFIKTLIVGGSDVENASITFNKGLNVISGASDTGKSYIYQCIYFLLGGSSRPKVLEKEDTGYEYSIMEIETSSGDIHTIKRFFAESFYHIWNDKLERALQSENYKIYNLKDSNSGETISNFYISLINKMAHDFQIKKNARGVLQTFTISTLKPYFMVNETKIIDEKSVFYNKGYGVSALELSAFRTLLISKDDRECEEVESPDVSKARLQGKIEYLSHVSNKLNEKIELATNKLASVEITSLIEKRELLLKKLKDMSEIKQNSTYELETIWHSLNEKKTKVLLNIELDKRFLLLKDALYSDLERLGFIEEGTHYLNQLEIVHCPTCNSIINEEVKIPDIFFNSCYAEKAKIKEKLKDLEIAISEIKIENENIETKIKLDELKTKEIEKNISGEINPSIQITNIEIEMYNSYLYAKHELDNLNTQLQEVHTEYDYYTSLTINSKVKSEYDNSLSIDIYSLISKEIESTLIKWNYGPSVSVSYSKEQNDFIINGKSRISYGKGHRALLYSAFIISVLRYCIKTPNLTLHPGIVILDSPLTSYKDHDIETQPESDRISKETEQLFFDMLKDDKTVQIIIFDNKEPKEETRSGLTFHHFSGSKKQGRYGFFPDK